MISQVLRKITRGVAVTLVATLTVAAWGDCVGKGAPLRVQMACCAADHHDRFADDAMKCCERTPLKNRLIVTESAFLLTPPAPVAAVGVELAASADARSSARLEGRALSRIQAMPAYIFTRPLVI